MTLRKLRMLLLAGVAAGALFIEVERTSAQSNPGWPTGFVPTAGQWAQQWSSKMDYPLPLPTCGALQWTTGLGISCNTALANSSGIATQLTTLDTVAGTVTYYPVFVSAIAGTSAPATSSTLLTWVPNFGMRINSALGLGLAPGNFWLGLGAGSSGFPPIQLTAGGPMTTPTGGAVEYDGTAFYLTPQAGNRAVNVVENFCNGSTDFTLTNGTASQQALNCSANGQLTLAVASYGFEAGYRVTSTGTVSHTWALQWGGGATFTISYDAISSVSGGTALATVQGLFSSLSSAVVVTGGSTLNNEQTMIKVRGTIRATVTGTFQPQIKLSAAPGVAPVMKAGSFIRLWPIGSPTVSAVGNWN